MITAATIIVKLIEAIIHFGDYWKNNKRFIAIVCVSAVIGVICLFGAIFWSSYGMAATHKRIDEVKKNLEDHESYGEKMLGTINKRFDEADKRDERTYNEVHETRKDIRELKELIRRR